MSPTSTTARCCRPIRWRRGFPSCPASRCQACRCRCYRWRRTGPPDRLRRVDLTGADGLREVGTDGIFDDTVLDMALGDGLLVAARRHAVVTVDVSDPATPVLTGAFREDGSEVILVWSSAFQGRNLLLGSRSCLRVIDMSAPSEPRQIGALEIPAEDVTVLGDRIFTTEYELGVFGMQLDHPPLTTFSDACQPFEWVPMRHGAPQVSQVVLPVVLSWR